MGKYLKLKGLCVSGYYDVLDGLSLCASRETGSVCFGDMAEMLRSSDVVFVTVNDDAIPVVARQLQGLPVGGKWVFHCSGALSSDVFAGLAEAGANVGSAHPVCAVKDNDSAEAFFGKFFVLEGDEKGLEMLKHLMDKTGNGYRIVSKADKAKYHAAMVMSSNMVCALARMSEDWLADCGFDGATARAILVPLMKGNVDNIAQKGCVEALTGPVERGDAGTVQRHLGALDGDSREVYRLLSLLLVDMAMTKNPDKDYDNLNEVLQK